MRPARSLCVVGSLWLASAACGAPAGTTDQTTSSETTSPSETTSTTPRADTTAAPDTTIATTTTTAATSSSTGAPEQDGGVVYLLLEDLDPAEAGPHLVPVFRPDIDGQDAVGVVEALLAGPTSDEVAGTPSMSTAIPEGVEVLSAELGDGVATVDLSGAFDDGGGSASMFGRLAQVVFTLTRLDSVAGVTFEIDGEPVTVFSSEGIELDGPQARDDYLDLLPAVFVDQPAWGEPVESPVEVRGLSNVFEATSQVLLTDDDGAPLAEETVTASCGTGCWGEWAATFEYSVDRDQYGALIVWAESAEDGSRIHVREHPVQLR